LKTKALATSILLILGFLFVDSRLNLLIFKQEPSLKSSMNCSVLDEVKNLVVLLESEDGKGVASSISKIKLRLNLAYGLETGFSNLQSKPKATKESKLAAGLETAKKEFEKLGNLKESEIQGKIPEIEKVAKETENFVKPHCQAR
jgi:hypothetical protein